MTLTAAGHAVVERTVDMVLRREAELVDGLIQAERTALAGLLDRLLGEVAGQAGPRPLVARSRSAAGQLRSMPEPWYNVPNDR